jgi:hypothetical protein
MKNKQALLSALLGVMLFSGAVSALTPQTDWVWKKAGGFWGTAMAVAVGEDGFLYVAGQEGGCGDDIYVAKVNPTTQETVWSKKIDAACMQDDPTDIKVAGSAIYICGESNGSGVLIKLTTSGGDNVWKMSVGNETVLRGMSIDPVDGTIWTIGTTPFGFPYYALLRHIRDNGNSYEQINSENISHNGNSAYGWGVVATQEAVYVCGAGEDAAMTYPWIWKRSRGSSSASVNILDGTYGTGLVHFSMGVTADSIYTVTGNPTGGNFYVIKFNKDSGLKEAGKFVGSVGMAGPPDLYPRITVHPTQQIPVVTNGNSWPWTAVGYNKTLDKMWSLTPFTGMIYSVNGVAFEPGLYGAMYVAGGVDNGGAMAWPQVAKVSFSEGDGGTSKMVVAPNIIELTTGLREAGISVKLGPDKDFNIRIYDSIGNMLRSMDSHSNGNGYGNIVWDLRDRNAKLVAPGTYYAVTDAEGGMRAPIMVVIRRTK